MSNSAVGLHVEVGRPNRNFNHLCSQHYLPVFLSIDLYCVQECKQNNMIMFKRNYKNVYMYVDSIMKAQEVKNQWIPHGQDLLVH